MVVNNHENVLTIHEMFSRGRTLEILRARTRTSYRTKTII